MNQLHASRDLLRDKNLRIVFGVTLMVVIGVSSVLPALPEIIRAFGVGPGDAGLVLSLFTLPGIALTPVLGVLADRVGRRAVLVPSLVLFGLGGIACGLAGDFRTLLWLRVVQGAGAAALGSLNTAVIADMYAGPDLIKALGYNAGVLAMGTAAYPAIGGLLAMFGWRWPFFLHAVAIPLACVVLWKLDAPEPRCDSSLGDYFRQAWLALKKRRAAALLVLSLGTFFLLYGPFVTFFPVRLGELHGAPAWQIGVIVSVASLFTGLAASRLGRLAGRFGQERLTVAAYGFYGASMLTLLIAPSAWASLGPVILFGFGQGLAIPSLSAMLLAEAPAEHRGAFMAANGSALRIGQTLGPLAAGLAFSLAGHPAPFWLGAAVAAGLALFAWRELAAQRR